MPAPVRKSLHSSFLQSRQLDCAKALKDFITGQGSVNNTDLNPAIANDPVLADQCRRFGYMILQIGDELRTVYCKQGDLGKGFACPNCEIELCAGHMEQHLGGKIEGDSFKIIGPAYGNQNPPVYTDPVPVEDTRAQYAMNDEDKDNVVSNLLERRTKGMRILKAIYKTGDKGGEHELGEMMTQLPLDQRIQAEVWSYLDEYKAPPSIADIATEIASRGIDEVFQNKLEQYAHSQDEWLPQFMEQLVAQGKLRKTVEGWYIPAEGYSPPPIQGD